jgi:transcriptional regulator with XRE-family HTH domain
MESVSGQKNGYPTTLSSISNHIRKRRLDLGLTLKQAAALIGTTASLLHQWEKERRLIKEDWHPPYYPLRRI